MKLIPKITLISIIGFFLALNSCSEKEDFPDIPHIKYESFVKIRNTQDIDEKGILEFSFTDGNGDIGLYSYDTVAPFDYNLFITYFEKQNGEFKEVILTYFNKVTQEYDTINFNARIPIINSSGEDKAFKGKIEIELFINNYFSDYDTIRFDAYIKDRALNKSNVISTPEIVVKKS
jgi:hypothetical protein